MRSSREHAASRLRCRTCGSTATHSRVFGMPTPELVEQIEASPWLDMGGCLVGPGMTSAQCLTCGARDAVDQTHESGFDEVPAPDLGIAEAITRYTSTCRAGLRQEQTSAISHAGLWLLLAGAAEHATGESRNALERTLGLPAALASEAARQLLAEPHPTVAAAAAAWAAADARTPLTTDGGIPSQAELDAWASEHTRGLIESFPVEVDGATRLLLATALVLEPEWTERLVPDEHGDLTLAGGLQTIVHTRAAGPVAVAKPHTCDAVDVVSIAAEPGVPPSRVWEAVDEVVALLNAGALRHGARPADLPSESAIWRSWIDEDAVVLTSTVETLPTDDFGRYRLWRSRLRPWATEAALDLTEAPGVAEVARTALPDEPGAEVTCTQAVRAEYDADGFRAAAVTALMSRMSAPASTTITAERVELDLTGPHAVVAIARGGAWEGIPLVSAWVTPDVGGR